MSKVKKMWFAIVFAVIIYLMLKVVIAPAVAYIFAIVVLLWALKSFFIKARIRFFSETLINDVPRQLKINNNVLINSHCIVKYFSKEKIIVIDKPKPKISYNLRSFIIDKTKIKDIVYCWGEICTIFDELTYLDTLYSYFDGFSGKLNIKFIDLSSDDQIVKDMAEFFRDPVSTDNESIKGKEIKSINEQNTNVAPVLVDINDLNVGNVQPALSQDDDTEYLKELVSENKIYVNYTDAQNISRLPGINIINAKKIVAYRDRNGLFRRKDDFIAVAKVKKRFVNIIKEMISLEKDPQLKGYENPSDYGRTVD